MKMWAVKKVHRPERVRNLNRYKRLVLAFLVSAVLIISIIYMVSFPPIAQSGSGGSSNSFQVYIGNATMTNVRIKGPYTYSSSNVTLNVTVVTATVVHMSNMSLIKEGSRLELEAPTAFATDLTVYTTYLFSRVKLDHKVNMTLYGDDEIDLPAEWLILFDAYMEVVYQHAESFSAEGLSLTYT